MLDIQTITLLNAKVKLSFAPIAIKKTKLLLKNQDKLHLVRKPKLKTETQDVMDSIAKSIVKKRQLKAKKYILFIFCNWMKPSF